MSSDNHSCVWSWIERLSSEGSGTYPVRPLLSVVMDLREQFILAHIALNGEGAAAQKARTQFKGWDYIEERARQGCYTTALAGGDMRPETFCRMFREAKTDLRTVAEKTGIPEWVLKEYASRGGGLHYDERSRQRFSLTPARMILLRRALERLIRVPAINEKLRALEKS